MCAWLEKESEWASEWYAMRKWMSENDFYFGPSIEELLHGKSEVFGQKRSVQIERERRSCCRSLSLSLSFSGSKRSRRRRIDGPKDRRTVGRTEAVNRGRFSSFKRHHEDEEEEQDGQFSDGEAAEKES